jgi:hypothetical protein
MMKRLPGGKAKYEMSSGVESTNTAAPIDKRDDSEEASEIPQLLKREPSSGDPTQPSSKLRMKTIQGPLFVMAAVYFCTVVITYSISKRMSQSDKPLSFSMAAEKTLPLSPLDDGASRKEHALGKTALHAHAAIESEIGLTPFDVDVRKHLRVKPVFRGPNVPNGAANGITASTQFSMSKTRLVRLADLASRWDGPISVAVYGHNDSDSETLMAFIRNSQDTLKHTIVNFITDDRASASYPINILRNIALEHAPTDNVLLLDVDFIPSVDSHSQLMKELASPALAKQFNALILPAFERRLNEGEEEYHPMELLDLPASKEVLLSVMRREPGTYLPFDSDRFPKGHGPTNFDKWYTSSEVFQVNYDLRFEPYFVVSKKHLPPLWEYFDGFGLNKWTWVNELHLAGYNFMVAPNSFLVHINHGGGAINKKASLRVNKKRKGEYDEYLKLKYPSNGKEDAVSPVIQREPATMTTESSQSTFAETHHSHHLLHPDLKQVSVLPVVTGAGTFWERSYFHAYEENCPSTQNGNPMVLVENENGFAAGPIIPSCSTDGVCDRHELLLRTFAFNSLVSNTGLHFHLPPQLPDTSNAIVWDRVRMNSSTGACFLDENHLVVASYGNRKVYLYHYNILKQSQSLLAEASTHCGKLDLVDCLPDGRVIVSCFTGEPELLRVDMTELLIERVKSIRVFDKLRQFNHDAEFYRFSQKSESVILACTTNQFRRNSLMVRFYDYNLEMNIADFVMDEHQVTKGYKAKGHRFIDDGDGRHFLVVVTKYDVRGYRTGCNEFRPNKEEETHSQLLLIRMDFDVDDILTGERPPAETSDFTVVGLLNLGVSAPDGLAYKEGIALVVDQLNDRLYQVEISGTQMKLLQDIDGYSLPHGVALSKYNNHFAVTCYGDNSVFIHDGLGNLKSHTVH